MKRRLFLQSLLKNVSIAKIAITTGILTSCTESEKSTKTTTTSTLKAALETEESTTTTIENTTTTIAAASADRPDSGISKMKYVHQLGMPLKGTAKNNQKLLIKKLASDPDLSKLSAPLPTCKFCKFWEEPSDGYGYCRYVAKKGNSKGHKAYKDAWCQMFKPENSIEKIKSNLKA